MMRKEHVTKALNGKISKIVAYNGEEGSKKGGSNQQLISLSFKQNDFRVSLLYILYCVIIYFH